MSVLAVAEHRRGELRDVSRELITAGAELTDALGEELHVAVVSGDTDAFAEQLDLDGVTTVHTVDFGDEFNHDVSVQAVTRLTAELDPSVLLFPNTVNGLDYVPAVAREVGASLLTDVVDVEAGDGLVATREWYGGKVEATLETDSTRVALTLRPGEWEPTETPGTADVRPAAVEIDESAIRTTVTGFEETASGDVDITEADVLVSIGRGIEEEDNLDIVFDLAEAMDATVSASRPIVDNGWLEKGRQVGQSGKAVEPDVYVAIGISGAVQHVAGMKNSGTIVAINTDPNAPIFDIADYGIVGDLFDVVPVLTEEFGG